MKTTFNGNIKWPSSNYTRRFIWPEPYLFNSRQVKLKCDRLILFSCQGSFHPSSNKSIEVIIYVLLPLGQDYLPILLFRDKIRQKKFSPYLRQIRTGRNNPMPYRSITWCNTICCIGIFPLSDMEFWKIFKIFVPIGICLRGTGEPQPLISCYQRFKNASSQVS